MTIILRTIRNANSSEPRKTSFDFSSKKLNNNDIEIIIQALIDHKIPVTFLKLSHNNISKLPENIGQLTELKRLDLSYNHLFTLPYSIGKLVKLNTLYSLSINDNNMTHQRKLNKIKDYLIFRNKILKHKPHTKQEQNENFSFCVAITSKYHIAMPASMPSIPLLTDLCAVSVTKNKNVLQTFITSKINRNHQAHLAVYNSARWIGINRKELFESNDSNNDDENQSSHLAKPA